MTHPEGKIDGRRAPGRAMPFALFGLAVLLLSGCGRGPDYDALVVRLVDAQDQAGEAPSSQEAPVAYDTPRRLPLPDGVIADERRYVLRTRETDPGAERLRIRQGAQRISRGPLTVPERAFLEFGFGVAPQGCSPGALPVTFRVYATRQASNRDPELLFEREVDPALSESNRRWMDGRIDLANFGGEEIVISFESGHPSGSPLQCPPMWGNPTIYARKQRPKNAHNFILVSIDTLRARNLGAYGYSLATSPFLDELASSSAVVFNTALTTAASTPQAHMSMFTGLYPSVHGITTGAQNLPRRLVTLAEILREAGYETGAVTEDGLVAPHYGFARGMNSFRENKSPDLFSPTGQVDLTVDETLRWLNRNSQKKFFLFLHTYQVHDPYAPPPDYRKLFAPYVHEGLTYPDEDQLPENLRTMREYDREIRYTDDELVRLFEGLRNLGLDESTIVFITSDHGEEFLEHGHYKHGAHLYDHEILMVPLIIRGPGTIKGPRRIETPVSIVDLTPTMLELAGLPQLDGLQGISLASVLTNPDAPPLPDRALFAEAWSGAVGPKLNPILWKRPALAIRTSHYKYIMRRAQTGEGHRFELYDLVADPQEKHNIAGASPDPWSSGRRQLQNYRARSAELQRALLGGAPLEEVQRLIPVDPQQAEKLRALGYIQ